MAKLNLIFLAMASAILLTLGWPTVGFAPLLLVALVPLLLIEDFFAHAVIKRSGKKVFLYAYLTFLLWNVGTTWWVWNSSPGGSVLAIVANSLLMALVFTFYHNTRKRLPDIFSPSLLIAFWVSFEYLHMHWDLSWSWLNLGNGFSEYYKWVQWYEYTGTLGGTAWLLLVNSMLTRLFKINYTRYKRHILLTAVIIVLPPVFSFALYKTCNSKPVSGNNERVVIVQPNIDPYNEKFLTGYEGQLTRMLQMAEKIIDSTTSYLVFPETALTENIWENNISSSYSVKKIKNFSARFPKLKIIIGATTMKAYEGMAVIPESARKMDNGAGYYDYFNTALQLDSSDRIQIYHKSILVPGVEQMPFPALLKPLESLAIDMGGTTGTLGKQTDRSVFTAPGNKKAIAPVICYESIYGNFVRQYVQNGAGIICIITNDGWWGDTPGYKQHLSYARLRAIETRRYIARSANTGISAVINERGDIVQATHWWQPTCISASIPSYYQLTFYTRYGDYLAYFAMAGAFISIIYSLLIRLQLIKK